MKYKTIYNIALILILVISPVMLSANTKTIIIATGGLSINDLSNPQLKNISSFIRNGSSAMINIRAGKPNVLIEQTESPGMESSFLTFGSGAMATAGAEARKACNANSISKEIYLARINSDSNNSMVLQPEIAKIIKINDLSNYKAVPGSLGSALKSAGMKTAVYGNSDTSNNDLHREITTLIMDRNGKVDFGDVENGCLEKSPTSPYSTQTNISYISNKLSDTLKKCDVIAIDFGDTFRADIYSQNCFDTQAAKIRFNSVKKLDNFIGMLKSKINSKNDVIILFSPIPPALTAENEKLTPIIISGNKFTSGLLKSSSTRKPGLITLSDIAPTILNIYNITIPEQMVGRPLNMVADQNPAEYLLSLNEKSIKQSERQILMRISSVVMMILASIATFFLIFVKSKKGKILIDVCCLICGAILPSMLVLPIIADTGLAESAIIVFLLSIAISLILKFVIKDIGKSLFYLCAGFFIILILDLSTGAKLISSSVAGYSLSEGARYYGIGNELMGAMIGLVCALISLMRFNFKESIYNSKLIPTLLFGATFVYIGAPFLGANVGGALSAAPAATATILCMRSKKISLKFWIILMFSIIAAIALVLAIDYFRSGNQQTHAGRFTQQLIQGNFLVLIQVFIRKMTLNFMLVGTSLWSRLLLLNIICTLVLYYLGKKQLFKEYFMIKEQHCAYIGCWAGLIAAFVFNDSGVVAAATCSIYLWTTIAACYIKYRDNVE